MFQTTLINGVGMLVYASTIFLPTRLFASLMFSLLAAALIGDLVFLPALLVGPLGKFLQQKKPSRTHSEYGRLPKPALVRLLADWVQPSLATADNAVPAMAESTVSSPEPVAAAKLVVPRRRRNASVDDVVFALYKAPRVPPPHISSGDFASDRDPALSVPAAYHEACRKILGSVPREPTPILLFASSDASFNSAGAIGNLAIAMTKHIDEPVLAIDMSRNAALTGALDVEDTNALLPTPVGRTNWQDRVCQTHVTGLRVLPKRSDRNGTAQAALRELLANARSSFGLVMIDLGGYDEMPIPEIASACSGAFLTLCFGQTPHDEVRAASRWLQSSGVGLTGCLLIETAETRQQDGRLVRHRPRSRRRKRQSSKLLVGS